MRKLATGIALAAVVAFAGPAFAQGEDACELSDKYRDFKGKVDRINKRELIIDNRKGDKLKFKKPKKDPKVMGEKDKWARIKKNDWVIASWLMTDNPRIAYEVCVLPEQEEAGEEVD